MLIMGKKGHNPLAVANFFIKKRKEERGIPLMKLIKLCYFAHGFTLALNDDILIDEYAEAWKYGPVYPSIFHEFKAVGLIKKLATRYNLELEKIEEWHSDFSDYESSIMEKVNDIYGKMTGRELSIITHRENSPWAKAWKKGENIRGFSICNKEIKNYFQKAIEENKKP